VAESRLFPDTERNKVAPPAPFLYVSPNGRAAIAAKCVPDTVDPRGPKGE
jgi:hypothetical protein